MRTLKGGIPVCYDYDDFNSQHDKESMKAVVDAYLTIFGRFVTDEQRMAMVWTCASIDNMTVKGKEDKDTYKAAGTLFSGWRLTSFINTVLNRVYLEEAGLKEKLLYSVHNGDDVFGIAENFRDVIDLMANAEALGLRAQKTKQNIGTIAEFLRFDLFAEDESASQYLARACSTIVHGRVECGESFSLDDEIKSVMTRGKALMERGGCKMTANDLTKRQLLVKCDKYETDPAALDMALALHPMQGGINPDAELRQVRVVRKALKEDTEDTKLVMRGVNDYIDKVAASLKISPSKIGYELRSRAAQMNFKTTKYRLIVVQDDRRGLASLRLIYKAHNKSRSIAHLSKARLLGSVGLDSGALNSTQLAAVVARSRRPLEFLSVIS